MIQKGPAQHQREQDRLRDRPPRTGGVKPGTEDVTIVDDQSRPEPHERDAMVTRKDRKVAGTIMPFVLIALILATIVTSFLTQRWEFLLALLVFVPYLFLISAPLWLASATKTAQDEDARDLGNEVGNEVGSEIEPGDRAHGEPPPDQPTQRPENRGE